MSSLFRTIVADPPWPMKETGREGFAATFRQTSRPMPYSTMSIEEICSLEVPAEKNAHLYVWTTNAFLADAFRVVCAWGFKYSTTLVWAKAPMGGGLGGCYGIATEYALFARRGTLPATSRVGRNWFNWKRPYDSRGKPKHSAKPAEFFSLVESVSPGPYLEMFTRSQRPGWAVWGNEVQSDVEITA